MRFPAENPICRVAGVARVSRPVQTVPEKHPGAFDRGWRGWRGCQTKAADECASLAPAFAGSSLAHSGLESSLLTDLQPNGTSPAWLDPPHADRSDQARSAAARFDHPAGMYFIREIREIRGWSELAPPEDPIEREFMGRETHATSNGLAG